SHADVAAKGQGGQSDLVGAAADAKGAPGAVLRQVIHQVEQVLGGGLHTAGGAQTELEVGRGLEHAGLQVVLGGVEHAHVEDLDLRLDIGGDHLLAAQLQELGLVHKHHAVEPVHSARVKGGQLRLELLEGADALLPGEALAAGGGQVEQHGAAGVPDQAHSLLELVKPHAGGVVVVPHMDVHHGGTRLIAAQGGLSDLLGLGGQVWVVLLGGHGAGEGGGDNDLGAMVETLCSSHVHSPQNLFSLSGHIFDDHGGTHAAAGAKGGQRSEARRVGEEWGSGDAGELKRTRAIRRGV